VLYRLYTPQDFPQLYAIEEICFQPPFRFGRRYMQRLVNSPNGATWIAEVAGRMAGFAIVEWMRGTDGAVAYIQTIEVAPEWRKQGVGAELLRRIEGSARSADAEAIWLHVDAENADAIRVYRAGGYVQEGMEEDYYAPGRAAAIYAKPLRIEAVRLQQSALAARRG
jgi:ribosomal-protein-alanine N-acetyltransferase